MAAKGPRDKRGSWAVHVEARGKMGEAAFRFTLLGGLVLLGLALAAVVIVLRVG